MFAFFYHAGGGTPPGSRYNEYFLMLRIIQGRDKIMYFPFPWPTPLD